MSLRLFRCPNCQHEMRLGAGRCGRCDHAAPFYNWTATHLVLLLLIAVIGIFALSWL